MKTLSVLGLLLWLAWPLAQAQERPRVLASIEPLAMMVREVVGESVQVDTLLTPNQTPHDHQLTPSQQRQLLEAPLLLWLGEEAEPAVASRLARRTRAALAMMDVPTVQRRYAGDHHHDHAHPGHSHDHSGAALDGHLWLSPFNVGEFAASLVPHHAHFGLDREEMAHRVEVARARWQALEKSLQQRLAPYATRPYVSHHDAWGYFYDAMHLRPVITLSDNLLVTPGTRTFTALAVRFRDEGIRCVLAEPEGSLALLQRLCSGDCEVVPLDPLGRNLGGQHYSALLQHVGERFEHCLSR